MTDEKCTCPICGPETPLLKEDRVIKREFLEDPFGTTLIERDVDVVFISCDDCGHSVLTSQSIREVHNTQCMLHARATTHDINKLKEIVEQHPNIAKKYTNWKAIAEIIIGIGENTLHRHRRLDGIPSMTESHSILDAINNDCIILDRIARWENRKNENTSVGKYDKITASSTKDAIQRCNIFELRLAG